MQKIFATYTTVCVKGDQRVQESSEIEKIHKLILKQLCVVVVVKWKLLHVSYGVIEEESCYLLSRRRQASRSILCFPRNTNSIYPSCIWEQQMFVISRPFLRKTNFFWTKYWHYSSLIYKRWILYLYGVNKICLRHLMAASFYNFWIMIEIDGNLSSALFYNSWLRLQICVVANIKQSENTVIRLKM